MSGGHIDYDCSYDRLNDMADTIDKDGDPLLADFIRDVGTLMHDYDWYKSGDTCKKDWHESRKVFVKKWRDTSMDELMEASIRKRVDDMLTEMLTDKEIPWWDE